MFEWDPNKERLNRLKHRVGFADTFAVFEDPLAITVDDVEDREDRFVTIGTDSLGRVLVVVYTWRGESIRIISARKATPSEAEHYESRI